MPNRARATVSLAACALAAALAVAACGGGQPKPSVQACTNAYPAWFAASAAAQKTAPTPAACKGLSQSQVARIGENYLTRQGG